jgi:hypothetical protein
VERFAAENATKHEELQQRDPAIVAIALAVELVAQVGHEHVRDPDELEVAVLEIVEELPHERRARIIGKRTLANDPQVAVR